MEKEDEETKNLKADKLADRKSVQLKKVEKVYLKLTSTFEL